jgi:pimeloyl-ACP methyl ester carboxylesterase
MPEVRGLYSAMLARLLRILLLGECATYGAIAYCMNARYGWPGTLIAIEVIAMALVVRLAIVCTTETIAAISASPRATALQIGPAAALAMVLREWRASAAANFVRFPFERWTMRPDAPPIADSRTPIVLAHGFFSNRGYFGPLLRALEARRIGPCFAPNFSATFATIERYAEELHVEIERIAEGTGRDRVILLCHSMGGLAARAYMAVHGTARVARLITIASPHHGSVVARLGAGENARQMEPGSVFLADLLKREGAGGPGVATTSIYSAHDNLVAPQHSSRLDWARNVPLRGRGHIEMLHSAELADLLAAELGEARGA